MDLYADLGPSGVMVFGSPKQRGTTPGTTREEAKQRWMDGLARVAPHAEERGATILVEALPSEPVRRSKYFGRSCRSSTSDRQSGGTDDVRFP